MRARRRDGPAGEGGFAASNDRERSVGGHHLRNQLSGPWRPPADVTLGRLSFCSRRI